MLPITEGYNLTNNSSLAGYLVVFLIIFIVFIMFDLLFIGLAVAGLLTFMLYLFQKNAYPGEIQHKLENKKTPTILYGNRKE